MDMQRGGGVNFDSGVHNGFQYWFGGAQITKGRERTCDINNANKRYIWGKLDN